MIVPKRQKKTGLDALANASRPVSKFVKEFSSKHQGLFQKVLHLFEKVLSSFSAIIFGKTPSEIELFFTIKGRFFGFTDDFLDIHRRAFQGFDNHLRCFFLHFRFR